MKKNQCIYVFLVLICCLFAGCNSGSSSNNTKSSGKAMSAFSLPASIAANSSAGITSDITGNITGNEISATVPFGTNLSSLTAIFTVSENAVVTSGSEVQQSGVTQNNFSSPVVYKVKAEDGSTQTYTVTVTIAPDNFYVWGKTSGGEYRDSLIAFCTDRNGNAYMSVSVGWSYSSSNPSYLIKINSDGSTGWKKEIAPESTFASTIEKLAADSNGNIFAKSSIHAGAVISKIDSSGNELWKKTINDQGSNPTSNVYNISAMTADPSGAAYLAGKFMGSVDFDPGAAEDKKTAVSRCNEERCTSNNNFLTKINSDGSYGGTTVFDSIADFNAVKSDSSGNIYITGNTIDYYSALWNSDFDPGEGVDQKTTFGGSDIFIMRINANGSYAWTKVIGGSGDDVANDLSVDRNGNIYLTGSFKDRVDFDPGSGEDFKTASVDNDVFLTKINSDGSYGWTKAFEAGETATGQSVTVDDSGNIYLAGYFWGSADFDPGTGTDTKRSVGNSDIFLTRINKDGSYSWTKTFEPDLVLFEETKLLTVTSISGGDVFLGGVFYNSMDLNPGSGTNIFTSNGYSDAFVARFHP